MLTRQKNAILRIGLPKGSLNDPNGIRGDTNAFLKQAGYDVVGYEPGREDQSILEIRNDCELEPWLIRPQFAGIEAGYFGLLDLLILGADWAEEWKLDGIELEKLTDLSYSQTSLVLAVPSEFFEQRPSGSFMSSTERDSPQAFFSFFRNGRLRGYTEFPWLTQKYLSQFVIRRPDTSPKQPTVRFRNRIIQKGNPLLEIIVSEGMTELAITKGYGDFIVDTKQSGDTLSRTGCIQLDTVLAESHASLYATASALKDAAKRSKAYDVMDMLKSVAEARANSYFAVNVRNARFEECLRWLREEGMCGDEPTVTARGENYTGIAVLVPNAKLPAFRAGCSRLGMSKPVKFTIEQVGD